MLETGKLCVCCRQRKFLKDFGSGDICKECEVDNFDYFQKKQAKFYDLYKNNDPSISKCDCGTYFKNRGIYKKCSNCRYDFIEASRK